MKTNNENIDDEEIILWEVWGKFFEYPECCVEAFCHNRDNLDFYTVFAGSGFVPCKDCSDKISDMSEEEAFNWLGRDPFDNVVPYSSLDEKFLAQTKSKKFIQVAKELNFDYDEYSYWLSLDL